MSVPSNVIQMQETADLAARRLMDRLRKNLERSNARAVGHDIWLAVYDRAEGKTAGGIIIPETIQEDRFQGKVGLVISVGPMCHKHEDWHDWFGGQPPKLGDWVGVNIRDGFSFMIGDVDVRSVEWKYVRIQADVPDLVA